MKTKKQKSNRKKYERTACARIFTRTEKEN